MPYPEQNQQPAEQSQRAQHANALTPSVTIEVEGEILFGERAIRVKFEDAYDALLFKEFVKHNNPITGVNLYTK